VITEDLNPRHIYAGFPADHPAVNRSRRFPVVTAACALFRRSTFEAADGFDDAFKNGFEDVDLCLRLGEQGHEVHYCHESVAYHLEMGTRDFADEQENLELYRRRWAHKVQPDAIQRYVDDGLLRIRYNVRYPFSLHLSALLGLVEEDEREADALLATRADQVAELLRENIELKLLLGEAGLEAPKTLLSPPRAEKPETARAALFVSDAYGDSMRYRCDHHVEELELLGASADSHWLHQVPLGDMVEAFGCFVLHRVPMDEHVEAFIKEAHRHGKVVVYDTDELVFELPDPLEERHRATIAAADGVFVATEPLAERARKLNPNVFVIPNAVSRELVELADRAAETKARRDDGAIRLGYVTERPIDDLNFLTAADAVLSMLEENPAVHLLVFGGSALDDRFGRYRDRIERVPLQPWRRVPEILARIDVNLAPSGRDPVAESKSGVSWLVAALVGTPTIASPRSDLARVIEPGRNGLLAETPSEWRDALEELVASGDRRLELGREAALDARRLHSTEAQAPVLYDALVRVAGAAVRDRKLTINWLIGQENGGRSARELSRLAGELGWRGHYVRLFAKSAPSAVRTSVDFRGLASGPLPPADVAIASDAETAGRLAHDPNALFRFSLADGSFGDLPVPPLPGGEGTTLETDWLERALLDLCFARLDPMSPSQEPDEE